MTFGFALLTVGSLLAISGWRNETISEVLSGLNVTRSGPGDSGFTAYLNGSLNAVTPGNGGEGGEINPLGKSSAKGQKKKEEQLEKEHPELKAGIRTVTAVVMAAFPGLTITATTNGEHVSDSYHYKGRAVDLAGSEAEMNKAAKWISKYLTQVLTEGIHNPGLSVKEHKHVESSFWGAETWAAHANHIHLAV